MSLWINVILAAIKLLPDLIRAINSLKKDSEHRKINQVLKEYKEATNEEERAKKLADLINSK